MTVFDMEDGPVEFPWPDQERPIFHLNIEGRERRAGASYCNLE